MGELKNESMFSLLFHVINDDTEYFVSMERIQQQLPYLHELTYSLHDIKKCFIKFFGCNILTHANIHTTRTQFAEHTMATEFSIPFDAFR